MMFPYLEKRFPNLTLYRGGTMTAQSDALMLVEKIRWLETEVDRLKNRSSQYTAGEPLAWPEVEYLTTKQAQWHLQQIAKAKAEMKERCAMVADRLTSSKEIARRIRALKDK